MRGRLSRLTRSDFLTMREAADRLLRDPRLAGVVTTCALHAELVDAEWCVNRHDLKAWIQRQAQSRRAFRSGRSPARTATAQYVH
jgi:hypothetical protein